MTEIDTSRGRVEKESRDIERFDSLNNRKRVARLLRALLARAEKAEASLSQMRDAVAEIEGLSEGWPTHGNIPLAIVAGYSLHKSGREKAEAERDTAWNDAIEAAAAHITNTQLGSDVDKSEWVKGNNSGVRASSHAIRSLRKGKPT